MITGASRADAVETMMARKTRARVRFSSAISGARRFNAVPTVAVASREVALLSV
jgi:hypothetical protein